MIFNLVLTLWFVFTNIVFGQEYLSVTKTKSPKNGKMNYYLIDCNSLYLFVQEQNHHVGN